MALKNGDRANFETLKRACANGDLALLECKDKATGEYRAVICAVNRDDDGTVMMVPFGHLATDNPFEAYEPPEELQPVTADEVATTH